MSERVVTTQHYLNIADIREDILILRNGEFRQIIEITALNFALKSEQEQAAIIYQYQAFLNSLQFPVQILVQSRRLDLTRYLADLQQRLASTQSTLIRGQIADYLDFVGRLISLGNIMEKRFFAIIPYASTAIRGSSIIKQLLKHETVTISDKDFVDASAKIADRVVSVQSSLGSIGLLVRILSGEEIKQLLYNTYNPIEADEIALSNQATNDKQQTTNK